MATVIKYSHHFTVSQWHLAQWRDIKRFLVKFQQYATRYQRGVGNIRTTTSLYAEANASRTVIRLHINKFNDFMEFMEARGYRRSSFNVTEVPLYEPAKITPRMPSYMVPRDYQVPQVDYVLAPGAIKFLGLQTGKGKTFCALESVRRLGHRTFINVPAKYLPKWKDDIIEAFGDSVSLMVIQGGSQLRSLLAMAKAGELEADIILCSSNTLAGYLKEFRGSGTFTYEVEPYNMFKAMEVGIRIIDEVHEGLHFNYRLDCYTHVPKTISMSATVVPRDATLQTVVNYMFPVADRSPLLEYDRYVDVYGIGYKVSKPNLIKYKQNGMYNHHVYEQWLFSNKERLKAYTDLVIGLIRMSYINAGIFEQKILIYAASIDMCKHLAEQFSLAYPELEVTTKVQDDEFDVLESAQVIFSTLLSTGTAVDISDLGYVLVTTAVDSDTANLQAIGRLRRMKNYPEQTPLFYYLCCVDIDKHMAYHTNKQKLFHNKAKRHTWHVTETVIP